MKPAISHSVIIDNEGFEHFNLFLNKNGYDRIFILVDENTKENCLPSLFAKTSLTKSIVIEIPSGEAHKNLESCESIWNSLTENGANRKSLFINLGGGVIGDMGGFAASCFKRGLDFVNLPTTVLAAVDASIGGKLGIDFKFLKNQIGLFKSPKAVFINSLFFRTLSDRQIKSGYAEIVKHALISDGNYWDTLKKSKDLNNLDWDGVIARSVQIKSEIVQKDPFEESTRKVLNFGHTIGHAIETYSLENDKNPLLHGEAIAIGMICEAYLSVKHHKLKESVLIELCSYLNSLYLDYPIDHKSFEQLHYLMKQDKKNESELINFTLLKSVAEPAININIEWEFIEESLNFYNTLKTTKIE